MSKNIKIVLLLTCFLSCISCKNEDSLFDAQEKVEFTFNTTNLKGAKSLAYVSNFNHSRALSPGYYVVYENGDVEPFAFLDKKGKKHNIGIHNLSNLGDIVFIKPNYYDCCDAIGKGNGKTEQEALHYERLFRQFLIKKSSGKVYTLPEDFIGDQIATEGATVGQDGYIYAPAGIQGFVRINQKDMTIEIKQGTDTPSKLTYLKGGVILSQGWGGRDFEYIFPSGKIETFHDLNLHNPFILNDNVYCLSDNTVHIIDYNSDKINVREITSLADIIDEEFGYRENMDFVYYNPIRNSAMIFSNSYVFEFKDEQLSTKPVMSRNMESINLEHFDDIEKRIQNKFLYLVSSSEYSRINLNTYEYEILNIPDLKNYSIIGGWDGFDKDVILDLRIGIRLRDGAEVLLQINYDGSIVELEEANSNGVVMNFIPLN